MPYANIPIFSSTRLFYTVPQWSTAVNAVWQFCSIRSCCSVHIVCTLPTWTVFYLSASSQNIHLAQLDIVNKHASHLQVLLTYVFVSLFAKAGRWFLQSSSAMCVLDSCTPHFCKILPAVSLPANRLSQPERHAIIQSAGIWGLFFCDVQFITGAAQMYGGSALFHTATGLSRLGACLVLPVSCWVVAYFVFIINILLPKSL